MSKRITTATDLERMTPVERHAHFEASIITNLDDAPPDLIARARVRVEQHIAQRDAQPER